MHGIYYYFYLKKQEIAIDLFKKWYYLYVNKKKPMGYSRNKQNISVDGGHDYIRRCYQEEDKYEELSEYTNIEEN